MVMKGFQYISESAFIELILADISLSSKLYCSLPPPPQVIIQAGLCVYSLLTDLDSSGNRLSLTVRAHINSPVLIPSFITAILEMIWNAYRARTGELNKQTLSNTSSAEVTYTSWQKLPTAVVSWSRLPVNHPLQPGIETKTTAWQKKQVKTVDLIFI